MDRAARAGVLAAALAGVVWLPGLPAHADDLTGAWRGTVTLDGQPTEFTATFSENGYFLFTYTTNGGFVRTVELSGPGQVRFATPEGGVMTLVVESVVKRPQGIAYILRTSFERASNGYMEQQYITEEADYALTAEGLRVRIVRRPVSYFGDKGGLVAAVQLLESGGVAVGVERHQRVIARVCNGHGRRQFDVASQPDTAHEPIRGEFSAQIARARSAFNRDQACSMHHRLHRHEAKPCSRGDSGAQTCHSTGLCDLGRWSEYCVETLRR
jgi:hypothetical protein